MTTVFGSPVVTEAKKCPDFDFVIIALLKKTHFDFILIDALSESIMKGWQYWKKGDQKKFINPCLITTQNNKEMIETIFWKLHVFNNCRTFKFGKRFKHDLNRWKEQNIPRNLTYCSSRLGSQFLRYWRSKLTKTADSSVFWGFS